MCAKLIFVFKVVMNLFINIALVDYNTIARTQKSNFEKQVGIVVHFSVKRILLMYCGNNQISNDILDAP